MTRRPPAFERMPRYDELQLLRADRRLRPVSGRSRLRGMREAYRKNGVTRRGTFSPAERGGRTDAPEVADEQLDAFKRDVANLIPSEASEGIGISPSRITRWGSIGTPPGKPVSR